MRTGTKKLLSLGLLIFTGKYLFGQEIYQEFFFILIMVNPSAFQNGMTLENQVKIVWGFLDDLRMEWGG